jgi:hypothetical protein
MIYLTHQDDDADMRTLHTETLHSLTRTLIEHHLRTNEPGHRAFAPPYITDTLERLRDMPASASSASTSASTVLGNSLVVAQPAAGAAPAPKVHPGNIRCTFREHSGNIQGIFSLRLRLHRPRAGGRGG